MPSVQFYIDFGEPDGTVEQMGCEDFSNAQEIIDAMKGEGYRNVAEALQEWNLLDMGEVTVTYTPDIPPELHMKSVFKEGEEIPPFDHVKAASLQTWLNANQTKASWSDWDRHRKGDE